MKLQQQADLKSLNTFGVASRASLLFEVENEEDLLALPAWQAERDLLLGGGSNILLVDDVAGKVVLNRIRGIDVVDMDSSSYLLEIGAGENWHGLVQHAVRQGWHGLENLALIPGLVGAAPVQNIGAYGVELSEFLESVTAWDWLQSRWVVFQADQCELAYRDSIFKQEPRDRYFITSIRLRLHREFAPRLDYAGLRESLGDKPATAESVFDAVIKLRQQKLPDPAVIGNAGSFFKNPVLSGADAQALKQLHPDLPNWSQGEDHFKFSAAAMIQACRLKGHQRGAAAVSRQHALVLVNEGGASGAELWQLAQEVQARVYQQFGVALEPEPRIYRHEKETA
ncbi:MAG TPA: UDP-N-acetylmuramate dehydrogenase [Xanthomonadales bacterium]|nr:UDP-N-acetylmuramate dehydrogenase [Xanthomonadales bacterium]